MMSWSIHNLFFVLVDPYPFYCIKRVWIDQNKKGYGSTKTSLTVHAVQCPGKPLCPSLMTWKLDELKNLWMDIMNTKDMIEGKLISRADWPFADS